MDEPSAPFPGLPDALTGATSSSAACATMALRMRAPLIRHINEDPAGWAEWWTTGMRRGAIPYYMFVERDTGPSRCFRLPLAKAYETFQAACQRVSGLARTVRGPSMGAFLGKVAIDGIVTIGPAGAQSALGAATVLREARSRSRLAGGPGAGFRRERFFFQTGEDRPRRVIPIAAPRRLPTPPRPPMAQRI